MRVEEFVRAAAALYGDMDVAVGRAVVVTGERAGWTGEAGQVDAVDADAHDRHHSPSARSDGDGLSGDRVEGPVRTTSQGVACSSSRALPSAGAMTSTARTDARGGDGSGRSSR